MTEISFFIKNKLNKYFGTLKKASKVPTYLGDMEIVKYSKLWYLI